MEGLFNYKEVRKKLHDQITDAIVETNDEITGVTGWVLIVESALGPNKRSLFAIGGDIIGQNDLPAWTARGWLAEVSENIDYFLGPDDDGEEDDDD